VPERATVFQATQLGVESTKGTAVPANKRLLATMFNLSPQIPVEGFRPMGSKAFTTATRQKEWTEGDIEGVFAFNDIIYLLSGLLEQAAISTPTGATLTRRWLFNPANFTPDDYITYTIETGTTGGQAERAAFGLINEVTVRWTREEVSVNGSVLAQALADGITITAGPTDIPELPADPTQISLFVGSALTNEVQQFDLGAASAGTFTISFTDPFTGTIYTTAAIAFNAAAAAVQSALEATSGFQVGDVTCAGGPLPGTPVTLTFGGRYASINVAQITIDSTGLTGATVTITTTTPGGLTKLNRALEFEWSCADRFTPVFTLDQSKSSFSAEVERSPELSAELVLEADSEGVAFMTSLRNKTTNYCKAVGIGPTIELDFTRRFDLTFPFKFGEAPRDDQDDIWAITYALIPIYDATFGGWVKWTIDGTLTAL
jgi:hypothetical protein